MEKYILIIIQIGSSTEKTTANDKKITRTLKTHEMLKERYL